MESGPVCTVRVELKEEKFKDDSRVLVCTRMMVLLTEMGNMRQKVRKYMKGIHRPALFMLSSDMPTRHPRKDTVRRV